MFRDLAPFVAPAVLVNLTPLELTSIIEGIWRSRAPGAAPWDYRPPGEPRFSAALAGNPVLAPYALAARIFTWPHLIYAYMVENTRIYEIFRRVVYEFVHGERLGAPNPPSQGWLRNTEELFYRDTSPFAVRAIDSHVRPDLRATRRNAYQRMFGMNLNHGADDNQPYNYPKSDAANNEFVSTFEELLREVWVGMINLPAIAAPRQTDDQKIADLADRLRDMLRSRRYGGNLSREEFSAVVMMSWFHMTIETLNPPLPILTDLRVTASGAEQALFHIAQRVGLPAHGLTRSYFQIADPLSDVLLFLENFPGAAFPAPPFYTPPGALEAQMRIIINHWSTITGRDVKARKVATA